MSEYNIVGADVGIGSSTISINLSDKLLFGKVII